MRHPIILAMLLAISVAACATKKPAPAQPPPPPIAGHTATLDITGGMQVVGALAMPSGFTPVPAWPPMWLEQGREIAVAGLVGDKATVIAFGGSGLADQHELGEDFGPLAPGGRIVDIAASPDGMELATAVAEPTANRLEVVVTDVLAGGSGHPVATFDGDYPFVTLQWLDPTTIALSIRAAPPPPDQAAAPVETLPPAGGFYAIRIGGPGTVAHFDKIRCPLAGLSFSPSRRYVVSEGDAATHPAIVDLDSQACVALSAPAPLKVLGWAPDSSAFIYAANAGNGGLPGVFRYTIANGTVAIIAVSSSAAAWASDGTILAMGNSQLSWKRVAQAPAALARIQIALFSDQHPQIQMNGLGYQSLPAMLARSTMTFTAATDTAAIDAIRPGATGPLRELIDYSYPARAAFIVAEGPARGPLIMSWGPDGRTLAMLDGDRSLAMLTVIVPPR